MNSRTILHADQRSSTRCVRNLRRAGLLAAAAMFSLGCAAAGPEPWPDPELSQATLVAADEVEPGHVVDADELAPLRNNAALGDVDSGVQLATELVDRYETSRGKDDLFEAVLWIDRFHGTDTEARSGVVERISQKHCD